MSLNNIIELLDWEYTDDIKSMLNTLNKFITKKEIIKRNECGNKIFLCTYDICCVDMYLDIYN